MPIWNYVQHILCQTAFFRAMEIWDWHPNCRITTYCVAKASVYLKFNQVLKLPVLPLNSWHRRSLNVWLNQYQFASHFSCSIKTCSSGKQVVPARSWKSAIQNDEQALSSVQGSFNKNLKTSEMPQQESDCQLHSEDKTFRNMLRAQMRGI